MSEPKKNKYFIKWIKKCPNPKSKLLKFQENFKPDGFSMVEKFRVMLRQLSYHPFIPLKRLTPREIIRNGGRTPAVIPILYNMANERSSNVSIDLDNQGGSTKKISNKLNTSSTHSASDCVLKSSNSKTERITIKNQDVSPLPSSSNDLLKNGPLKKISDQKRPSISIENEKNCKINDRKVPKLTSIEDVKSTNSSNDQDVSKSESVKKVSNQQKRKSISSENGTNDKSEKSNYKIPKTNKDEVRFSNSSNDQEESKMRSIKKVSNEVKRRNSNSSESGYSHKSDKNDPKVPKTSNCNSDVSSKSKEKDVLENGSVKNVTNELKRRNSNSSKTSSKTQKVPKSNESVKSSFKQHTRSISEPAKNNSDKLKRSSHLIEPVTKKLKHEIKNKELKKGKKLIKKYLELFGKDYCEQKINPHLIDKNQIEKKSNNQNHLFNIKSSSVAPNLSNYDVIALQSIPKKSLSMPNIEEANSISNKSPPVPSSKEAIENKNDESSSSIMTISIPDNGEDLPFINLLPSPDDINSTINEETYPKIISEKNKLSVSTDKKEDSADALQGNLNSNTNKNSISEEAVSSSSLEIKPQIRCDSPDILEIITHKGNNGLKNSSDNDISLMIDLCDVSDDDLTILSETTYELMDKVSPRLSTKHSSLMINDKLSNSTETYKVFEIDDDDDINKETDQSLDELTQTLISIIQDIIRLRERYYHLNSNSINSNFNNTEMMFTTRDFINSFQYKIVFMQDFLANKNLENLSKYASPIVEKFNKKLNFSFNSSFINILHETFIEIPKIIQECENLYPVEKLLSRIITQIDNLPNQLFTRDKNTDNAILNIKIEFDDLDDYIKLESESYIKENISLKKDDKESNDLQNSSINSMELSPKSSVSRNTSISDLKNISTIETISIPEVSKLGNIVISNLLLEDSTQSLINNETVQSGNTHFNSNEDSLKESSDNSISLKGLLESHTFNLTQKSLTSLSDQSNNNQTDNTFTNQNNQVTMSHSDNPNSLNRNHLNKGNCNRARGFDFDRNQTSINAENIQKIHIIEFLNLCILENRVLSNEIISTLNSIAKKFKMILDFSRFSSENSAKREQKKLKKQQASSTSIRNPNSNQSLTLTTTNHIQTTSTLSQNNLSTEQRPGPSQYQAPESFHLNITYANNSIPTNPSFDVAFRMESNQPNHNHPKHPKQGHQRQPNLNMVQQNYAKEPTLNMIPQVQQNLPNPDIRNFYSTQNCQKHTNPNMILQRQPNTNVFQENIPVQPSLRGQPNPHLIPLNCPNQPNHSMFTQYRSNQPNNTCIPNHNITPPIYQIQKNSNQTILSLVSQNRLSPTITKQNYSIHHNSNEIAHTKKTPQNQSNQSNHIVPQYQPNLICIQTPNNMQNHSNQCNSNRIPQNQPSPTLASQYYPTPRNPNEFLQININNAHQNRSIQPNPNIIPQNQSRPTIIAPQNYSPQRNSNEIHQTNFNKNFQNLSNLHNPNIIPRNHPNQSNPNTFSQNQQSPVMAYQNNSNPRIHKNRSIQTKLNIVSQNYPNPNTLSQNHPNPTTLSQYRPNSNTGSQNHPSPNMVSQNHPSPNMVSQNHTSPNMVSQNHPNPAMVSQNHPNPTVVLHYRPNSNTVSQNHPSPMVSQNHPHPTTVSQNQPSPTMVSQNHPHPTTVSQNQPSPTMVSQNHPHPTTVSQNQPSPTTVLQNQPSPIIVSQNFSIQPNPNAQMNLSQNHSNQINQNWFGKQHSKFKNPYSSQQISQNQSNSSIPKQNNLNQISSINKNSPSYPKNTGIYSTEDFSNASHPTNVQNVNGKASPILPHLVNEISTNISEQSTITNQFSHHKNTATINSRESDTTRFNPNTLVNNQASNKPSRSETQGETVTQTMKNNETTPVDIIYLKEESLETVNRQPNTYGSSKPNSEGISTETPIKTKTTNANDDFLFKIFGDPLVCSKCENPAKITCRNCPYILYCGSTCERANWEDVHSNECARQN